MGGLSLSNIDFSKEKKSSKSSKSTEELDNENAVYEYYRAVEEEARNKRIMDQQKKAHDENGFWGTLGDGMKGAWHTMKGTVADMASVAVSFAPPVGEGGFSAGKTGIAAPKVKDAKSMADAAVTAVSGITDYDKHKYANISQAYLHSKGEEFHKEAQESFKRDPYRQAEEWRFDDPQWWAEGTSNVVGSALPYMALTAGTGAAAGALGTGLRASAIGAKLPLWSINTGTKVFGKVTIDLARLPFQTGAAALSSYIEGKTQAYQTYDKAKKLYLSKGMSEDQAGELAAGDARDMAIQNTLWNVPLNMFSTGLFMKPSGAASIMGRAATMQSGETAAAYLNRIRNLKVGNTWKKGAIDAALEMPQEAWEELNTEAAHQHQIKQAEGTSKGIISDWLETAGSTEGQTSAFWGAIGGATIGPSMSGLSAAKRLGTGVVNTIKERNVANEDGTVDRFKDKFKRNIVEAWNRTDDKEHLKKLVKNLEQSDKNLQDMLNTTDAIKYHSEQLNKLSEGLKQAEANGDIDAVEGIKTLIEHTKEAIFDVTAKSNLRNGTFHQFSNLMNAQLADHEATLTDQDEITAHRAHAKEMKAKVEGYKNDWAEAEALTKLSPAVTEDAFNAVRNYNNAQRAYVDIDKANSEVEERFINPIDREGNPTITDVERDDRTEAIRRAKLHATDAIKTHQELQIAKEKERVENATEEELAKNPSRIEYFKNQLNETLTSIQELQDADPKITDPLREQSIQSIGNSAEVQEMAQAQIAKTNLLQRRNNARRDYEKYKDKKYVHDLGRKAVTKQKADRLKNKKAKEEAIQKLREIEEREKKHKKYGTTGNAALDNINRLLYDKVYSRRPAFSLWKRNYTDAFAVKQDGSKIRIDANDPGFKLNKEKGLYEIKVDGGHTLSFQDITHFEDEQGNIIVASESKDTVDSETDVQNAFEENKAKFKVVDATVSKTLENLLNDEAVSKKVKMLIQALLNSGRDVGTSIKMFATDAELDQYLKDNPDKLSKDDIDVIQSSNAAFLQDHNVIVGSLESISTDKLNFHNVLMEEIIHAYTHYAVKNKLTSPIIVKELAALREEAIGVVNDHIKNANKESKDGKMRDLMLSYATQFGYKGNFNNFLDIYNFLTASEKFLIYSEENDNVPLNALFHFKPILYPLTDVEEFIAGVFVSPELAKILSKVTKRQNVFVKFCTLLSKLFKEVFTGDAIEGTILYDTIYNTLEHLAGPKAITNKEENKFIQDFIRYISKVTNIDVGSAEMTYALMSLGNTVKSGQSFDVIQEFVTILSELGVDLTENEKSVAIKGLKYFINKLNNVDLTYKTISDVINKIVNQRLDSYNKENEKYSHLYTFFEGLDEEAISNFYDQLAHVNAEFFNSLLNISKKTRIPKHVQIHNAYRKYKKAKNAVLNKYKKSVSKENLENFIEVLKNTNVSKLTPKDVTALNDALSEFVRYDIELIKDAIKKKEIAAEAERIRKRFNRAHKKEAIPEEGLENMVSALEDLVFSVEDAVDTYDSSLSSKSSETVEEALLRKEAEKKAKEKVLREATGGIGGSIYEGYSEEAAIYPFSIFDETEHTAEELYGVGVTEDVVKEDTDVLDAYYESFLEGSPVDLSEDIDRGTNFKPLTKDQEDFQLRVAYILGIGTPEVQQILSYILKIADLTSEKKFSLIPDEEIPYINDLIDYIERSLVETNGVIHFRHEKPLTEKSVLLGKAPNNLVNEYMPYYNKLGPIAKSKFDEIVAYFQNPANKPADNDVAFIAHCDKLFSNLLTHLVEIEYGVFEITPSGKVNPNQSLSKLTDGIKAKYTQGMSALSSEVNGVNIGKVASLQQLSSVLINTLSRDFYNRFLEILKNGESSKTNITRSDLEAILNTVIGVYEAELNNFTNLFEGVESEADVIERLKSKLPGRPDNELIKVYELLAKRAALISQLNNEYVRNNVINGIYNELAVTYRLNFISKDNKDIANVDGIEHAEDSLVIEMSEGLDVDGDYFSDGRDAFKNVSTFVRGLLSNVQQNYHFYTEDGTPVPSILNLGAIYGDSNENIPMYINPSTGFASYIDPRGFTNRLYDIASAVNTYEEFLVKLEDYALTDPTILSFLNSMKFLGETTPSIVREVMTLINKKPFLVTYNIITINPKDGGYESVITQNNNEVGLGQLKSSLQQIFNFSNKTISEKASNKAIDGFIAQRNDLDWKNFRKFCNATFGTQLLEENSLNFLFEGNVSRASFERAFTNLDGIFKTKNFIWNEAASNALRTDRAKQVLFYNAFVKEFASLDAQLKRKFINNEKPPLENETIILNAFGNMMATFLEKVSQHAALPIGKNLVSNASMSVVDTFFEVFASKENVPSIKDDYIASVKRLYGSIEHTGKGAPVIDSNFIVNAQATFLAYSINPRAVDYSLLEAIAPKHAPLFLKDGKIDYNKLNTIFKGGDLSNFTYPTFKADRWKQDRDKANSQLKALLGANYDANSTDKTSKASFGLQYFLKQLNDKAKVKLDKTGGDLSDFMKTQGNSVDVLYEIEKLCNTKYATKAANINGKIIQPFQYKDYLAQGLQDAIKDPNIAKELYTQNVHSSQSEWLRILSLPLDNAERMAFVKKFNITYTKGLSVKNSPDLELDLQRSTKKDFLNLSISNMFAFLRYPTNANSVSYWLLPTMSDKPNKPVIEVDFKFPKLASTAEGVNITPESVEVLSNIIRAENSRIIEVYELMTSVIEAQLQWQESKDEADKIIFEDLKKHLKEGYHYIKEEFDSKTGLFKVGKSAKSDAISNFERAKDVFSFRGYGMGYMYFPMLNKVSPVTFASSLYTFNSVEGLDLKQRIHKLYNAEPESILDIVNVAMQGVVKQMQSRTESLLKMWEQGEVIEKTKTGFKFKEFPTNYKANVAARTGLSKENDQIYYLAFAYELNNILNNYELNSILGNDPAAIIKHKAFNETTGAEYNKSYASNLALSGVEMRKRNAGLMAPGERSYWSAKDFLGNDRDGDNTTGGTATHINILTLKDNPIGNGDTKFYDEYCEAVARYKTSLQNGDEKVYQQELEKAKQEYLPYKEGDGTDAQGYVSLPFYLDEQVSSGAMSVEDAKLILDTVGKGKPMPKELTAKGIHLSPTKPVSDGYASDPISYKNKNGVVVERNNYSRSYLKLACVVLIPALTKGSKDLEALRNTMESNNIGLAVHKTGYKVGFPIHKSKKLNELEEEGGFNPNDVHQIQRKFYGIQQNLTPEVKQKINIGTQAARMLFEDLTPDYVLPSFLGQENVPVKDAYKKYNDIISKIIEIKMSKFKEKFSISDNYEILDFEQFHNALINSVLSDGEASINLLDSLNIRYAAPDENGDRKAIGFATPLSSSKVQGFLLSLVRREAQLLKLPGTSGVLVTGSPFTKSQVRSLDDVESKDMSNIIWSPDFDPAQGLKPSRMENGKVRGAQLIIPSIFPLKGGGHLDIRNYIDKNESLIQGRVVFKLNKLPTEIRELFGYRIPTQGRSTTGIFEVVGFLPSEMGSTVIAPDFIIAQMGSDNDGDKLYLYTGNYSTVYSEEEKEAAKESKNDLITQLEGLKSILSTKKDLSEAIQDVNTFIEDVTKEKKRIESVISGSLAGELSREDTFFYESLENVLDNFLEGLKMEVSSTNRELKAARKTLRTLKDTKNEFLKNVPSAKDIEKRIENVQKELNKFKNENKAKLNKHSFLISNYKDAIVKNTDGDGLSELENQLIQVYLDVNKSELAFLNSLQPLTTDPIKAVGDALGNKEVPQDTFSSEFEIYSFFSNADGKAGVGIFVNISSLHNKAAFTEDVIKLETPEDPMLLDSRRGSKSVRTMELDPGIHVFDGQNERIYNTFGQLYLDDGVGKVSDNLNRFVTAATDAAKDPIFFNFNVTKDVMTTIGMLISISDDKGGLGLEFPLLMLKQPIISKMLEYAENKKSKTASERFNFLEACKEYFGNIILQGGTPNIDIAVDEGTMDNLYYMFYKGDLQDLDSGKKVRAINLPFIDLAYLKENSKNPKIDYNNVVNFSTFVPYNIQVGEFFNTDSNINKNEAYAKDIEILYSFIKYIEYTKSFMKHNAKSNQDTSLFYDGGFSGLASRKKIIDEEVVKFFNNKAFVDINKGSFRDTQQTQGFEVAYQVFKDYGLYKYSAVQSLLTSYKFSGSLVQLETDIWAHIYSTVGYPIRKNDEVVYISPNETYNLVHGKTPNLIAIGEQFKEITQNLSGFGLENNEFIKNLKYVTKQANNTFLGMIDFNNSSLYIGKDEDKMTSYFIELLTHENEKVRAFADNLIAISFLRGAQSANRGSYHKFIPVSYLTSVGFYDKVFNNLHSIEDSELSGAVFINRSNVNKLQIMTLQDIEQANMSWSFKEDKSTLTIFNKNPEDNPLNLYGAVINIKDKYYIINQKSFYIHDSQATLDLIPIEYKNLDFSYYRHGIPNYFNLPNEVIAHDFDNTVSEEQSEINITSEPILTDLSDDDLNNHLKKSESDSLTDFIMSAIKEAAASKNSVESTSADIFTTPVNTYSLEKKFNAKSKAGNSEKDRKMMEVSDGIIGGDFREGRVTLTGPSFMEVESGVSSSSSYVHLFKESGKEVIDTTLTSAIPESTGKLYFFTGPIIDQFRKDGKYGALRKLTLEEIDILSKNSIEAVMTTLRQGNMVSIGKAQGLDTIVRDRIKQYENEYISYKTPDGKRDIFIWVGNEEGTKTLQKFLSNQSEYFRNYPQETHPNYSIEATLPINEADTDLNNPQSTLFEVQPIDYSISLNNPNPDIAILHFGATFPITIHGVIYNSIEDAMKNHMRYFDPTKNAQETREHKMERYKAYTLLKFIELYKQGRLEIFKDSAFINSLTGNNKDVFIDVMNRIAALENPATVHKEYSIDNAEHINKGKDYGTTIFELYMGATINIGDVISFRDVKSPCVVTDIVELKHSNYIAEDYDAYYTDKPTYTDEGKRHKGHLIRFQPIDPSKEAIENAKPRINRNARIRRRLQNTVMNDVQKSAFLYKNELQELTKKLANVHPSQVSAYKNRINQLRNRLLSVQSKDASAYYDVLQYIEDDNDRARAILNDISKDATAVMEAARILEMNLHILASLPVLNNAIFTADADRLRQDTVDLHKDYKEKRKVFLREYYKNTFSDSGILSRMLPFIEKMGDVFGGTDRFGRFFIEIAASNEPLLQYAGIRINNALVSAREEFSNWVHEFEPIRIAFEKEHGIAGYKQFIYEDRAHSDEDEIHAFMHEPGTIPYVDQESEDMHRFLWDTLMSGRESLPPIFGPRGILPKNFLPTLMKGTRGLHKYNPLNWSVSGFFEAAFTNRSEIQGDFLIDKETGRHIGTIPIRMFGHNIGMDQRSFDLADVFYAFKAMQSDVRHKNAVVDELMITTELATELAGTDKKKVRNLKRLNETISSIVYNQPGDIATFKSTDKIYNNREKRKMKEYRSIINHSAGEIERLNIERDNIMLDARAQGMSSDNPIYRSRIDKVNLDILDNETLIMNAETAMASLGAQISLTPTVQAALLYARIKGMAFNLTANFVDGFAGIFANFQLAATGLDWTFEEMSRATGIAFKYQAMGKRYSKFAKVAKILRIFGLDDHYTELHKGGQAELHRGISKYLNTDMLFKDAKLFDHLKIQPMVIAMLMHETAKDDAGNDIVINGVPVSWWDCYDDNGNWDLPPGVSGDTFKGDYDANGVFTKSKYAVSLYNKFSSLNRRTHGNYETGAPIGALRTFAGQAMILFRKWLPQLIKSRIGAAYIDTHTGREVKGIYRSFLFNAEGKFDAKQAKNALTWFFTKGVRGQLKEDFANNVDKDTSKLSLVDKENIMRMSMELSMLAGMSVSYLILAALAGGESGGDEEKDKNPFYKAAFDLNKDGHMSKAEWSEYNAEQARIESLGPMGFTTAMYWINVLGKTQKELSAAYDPGTLGDILLDKDRTSLLLRTMFEFVDIYDYLTQVVFGDEESIKPNVTYRKFEALGDIFVPEVYEGAMLDEDRGKIKDLSPISLVPVVSQFFGKNAAPVYLNKKFKGEAVGGIIDNAKKVMDTMWDAIVPQTIPHEAKEPNTKTRKVGTVVQVLDGDTYIIDFDGEQLNVRLPGVDTPEIAKDDGSIFSKVMSMVTPDAPFGQEAKEFAKVQLEGREVELEVWKKKDKYGRLLADVYVEGASISDELMIHGYAHAYGSEGGEVERWKEMENTARENREGVWSGNLATDPVNWKHSNFIRNHARAILD